VWGSKKVLSHCESKKGLVFLKKKGNQKKGGVLPAERAKAFTQNTAGGPNQEDKKGKGPSKPTPPRRKRTSKRGKDLVSERCQKGGKKFSPRVKEKNRPQNQKKPKKKLKKGRDPAQN